MIFEGVIGHGAVCEQLEKEAQSPGHAYLFAGPPNLGKAFVALEFAARLVGARGADRERVRRRSHPDVAVLGPEGKTGLGVEQARAAIAAAGLQPVESDRKVFIFDDGSMMTEAAANALLKTLEEPSASTVMIIVADAEEDLPATVASRCRTLRFGRVPDRELARALTEWGLSEERAGETARIAMGRPGLALTFVDRPEVGEFRRRWLSVPGRVTSRPGDAFRLADEMLEASAPLLAALDESQSREAEEERARGAEVPRSVLDSRERARQRAGSSLTAAGLEMLASWYVDAIAAQHGAPVRNPDLPAAELAKIRPRRAVRSAELTLQAAARLRIYQRPGWSWLGCSPDLAPIPSFGRGRRALWRLSWPAARAAAAAAPLTVERRGPIPRGAMVAAVNHFSFLDPLMAGLALRRPVRFLALDELWGQSRLLDGALASFGAIPLPRENRVPLRALRAAIGHLREGGAAGVFPEGRRTAAWGESPFRPGAAWLALRTGAPVVPVALWGTQNVMPLSGWVRRGPVRAVVCPAVHPAHYLDHPQPRSALTEAVRAAIEAELRRFSG